MLGPGPPAVGREARRQPAEQARPNWFRGLFEQMRDELFKLFAMSFVINVLALTVSLFTLVVYSIVIPSGAPEVWGLVLFAVVATVGGWVLRIGRQVASSRLGAWAGTRIAAATMRKMLALPIEVTTRFGVQNNVVRMHGFENARAFLSAAGGLYLIDYPFIVIFLVVPPVVRFVRRRWVRRPDVPAGEETKPENADKPDSLVR